MGRHDWVIAACPVTIGDFKNGLATMGGVELSALSRLMSTNAFKSFLNDNKEQICEVIQERLSGDIVKIPRNDFERLIRTIGDFPTVNARFF